MSDSTFILKGNNPYTGEPIYEEVPGEMYHIPAKVDNKSFSADFNQPMFDSVKLEVLHPKS